MAALFSNFKKYGEAKGYITITDATFDECDAVNCIISPKKAFSPPVLKFRMIDFEKSIHNSVYADADLKEVLELYFQQKIISNKNQRLSKEQSKRSFQEVFMTRYNDTPCYKWIDTMFKEYKFGYRLLMKEFTDSSQQAHQILNNVCMAVNSRCSIKAEPIQLAVLSANITGNSHYFDKNTSAGKLFIHALAFICGTQEYKNAEEIKEIYSLFSIEPDSISGASASIGIRLFYSDMSEHPAYKVFADLSEICLISTVNLHSIKYADSDTKTVFIVENQMVFSALAEIAFKYKLSLLCTSGQLKSAGLKLIDMLIENNCNIYYAGDFDPEGIQIADKLLNRYNSEKFHVWRMSVNDYNSIEKSDENITEQRLKKFNKISSPILKEVSNLILADKRAAYQELLIPKMIDDMKEVALLYF